MRTKLLIGACLPLWACQPSEPATETSSAVKAASSPEPITETISEARAAEIEKVALDLLAYQEGVWDCRWEWLGKDGEIVGIMEDTETFEPLVDEYSQKLTNVVPQFNQTSYAMLSYNPVERKIVFLNVGPRGDVWIMRQDPETGTMISDPHTNQWMFRWKVQGKGPEPGPWGSASS